MKKTLLLGFVVAGLALSACGGHKEEPKNVDSLQNAAADSLLNAAMGDSTAVDSAKVDTAKAK